MNNQIFRWILIVPFLLLVFELQGQSPPVEQMKYDAYVRHDYTKWVKTADYVENNTDLTKTENMHELVHCYYALASVLIENKKDAEAIKAINKGKSYVNELSKKNPNDALAWNYKGVFIGYEIALNKMKALSLGKQSTSCLGKAYQLAPNNPQILFDKGNALYYTPKMFGGDKTEALKYFQKAIAIYEKQHSTQTNWVYLQLLVVEGHSYELQGNYNAAEKSYLKALKQEPNFNLVKNNLYPKLKAKMNGTAGDK
ncbi:MAG: tetratricopeptide repeat protein [Paludibacteraceae bacterium]